MLSAFPLNQADAYVFWATARDSPPIPNTTRLISIRTNELLNAPIAVNACPEDYKRAIDKFHVGLLIKILIKIIHISSTI